jgi:hypothetical protein
MPELNAELKAELLAIGSVDVDESMLAGNIHPFRRSRHGSKIIILQIR